MTDKLEQKLDKLDERVDRIDVTLGRVDERLRSTYELLEKHDTKATAALLKAGEAHQRIDKHEALITVPLKWARGIAILAGGISAAYGIYKLLVP